MYDNKMLPNVESLPSSRHARKKGIAPSRDALMCPGTPDFFPAAERSNRVLRNLVCRLLASVSPVLHLVDFEPLLLAGGIAEVVRATMFDDVLRDLFPRRVAFGMAEMLHRSL